MADEMGVKDLRANLADVINDAAVRGKTTYVTSRGRRVAAVVPVPIAEEAEQSGHEARSTDEPSDG